MGYSHPAVKIFMPAGAEEPVIVDYIEHYPPDTAAAVWWTKNRRPEKWRERRDEQPLTNANPLKVELSNKKDLLDPEKQENLEISDG